MIETYRGVVYPHQLDHMGHMNVQWYTSKFDEGTWHLFSAVGLTTEYMRSNHRGMAAVEQKMHYKAEAMAGDLLFVKSRVLELMDKAIRYMHVMYNAESGLEIATSEIVAVHMDSTARKACSFPEFVSSKSAALI